MNELSQYKRIMIIGSCGSGKTILAIQLSKILKMPIIHLDKEYWKPNWQETPKEEWEIKQKEFVENEYWIIDGNYAGTFDLRMGKADVVIFLDYNRFICLYRIIKRWLQNIGKTRIDMGEGCNEKIDLPFIKFVWQFPKKSRKKIINKLEEYKNLKQIILRNQNETNKFIKKLNNRVVQ